MGIDVSRALIFIWQLPWVFFKCHLDSKESLSQFKDYFIFSITLGTFVPKMSSLIAKTKQNKT